MDMQYFAMDIYIVIFVLLSEPSFYLPVEWKKLWK